MKIAAAYIRVSTEEQTELSPDSQVRLIREYAKKNGYILPDEFIFHDDGISGRTTAKRPGFNQMIGTAKLKPKPFDAILLWKFSRFARNREDSIVYKSMLRKLGIDVISISENVGDDKMSVLIEAMIEAMDEYYSINLAEEVKRGMLEKLSRGKAVNAPPIGYTIKNGTYVPDANADLIKRIFSDFLDGIGYLNIARRLNDEGYRTLKGNRFENRTIEYIIRNPVYAGKLRWTPGGGGSRSHYHGSQEVMVTEGSHQPIIPPDLWEKAQERANELKQHYGKFARDSAVKNDFMLRGLLRCSDCGAVLVNSGAGYQCHRYAHGFCEHSHYISKAKADEAVLKGLREAAADSDIHIETRSTRKNQTAAAENTELLLRREYEKLQRVREAYAAGIDTLEDYKENKRRLNEEIERLKAVKAKAEENRPPMTKEQARRTLMTMIDDFLILAADPNVTPAVLNSTLRTFVSSIVFSRSDRPRSRREDEKVTIFYYV